MRNASQLPERVARTIRKHRMLQPGDRVLAGVSGGADSVCLARILQALADELGLEMAIAHVNHHLRGAESDQDEAFVRQLAAEMDVAFFRRSAPIREGGNLEASARQARRDFFAEARTEQGFSRVALAHSRDDRVETFLMHLMRGSGTEGLTSMRPVSGSIVRPLIETPRGEIEAYLNEIEQPFRTDASNRDPRFTRNRIRHAVIPELSRSFNPRLSDSLARTAEILTAESDWMAQAAEAWLEGRTGWHGSILSIDINDLNPEPPALVRRVLRHALRLAGSGLEDVGYERIEQLRSLLGPEKSGKVIELPGRIQVQRNFQTLLFEPQRGPTPSYEYALPIPGRVHIPEIDAAFEARPEPLRPPSSALKPNQHKALVDGESLGAYVKIRNWNSGDFYNPVGGRASKLKSLFQRDQISLRNRLRWPVVVAGSSIVWVASFPVSRDFAPRSDHAGRVVELEVSLSPEMVQRPESR